MALAQFRHVRTKRTGTGCNRLVLIVAQQRVEPDQAAAICAQATGRQLQPLGTIAVEAVGEQQHECVLAEYATGPMLVEVIERRPDPCPTGPIIDVSGDLRQRHIGIAVLQSAGDMAQPGTEQERVDAIPIIGQRMQKMQKNARIGVHAAGDVDQHDNRRPSCRALMIARSHIVRPL